MLISRFPPSVTSYTRVWNWGQYIQLKLFERNTLFETRWNWFYVRLLQCSIFECSIMFDRQNFMIMFDCQNFGVSLIKLIEVNRTIEVRLPIFRLVTLSNVVWAEKKADTNAEKDRANRGHAQLKPSLPSFSLYSKVLMSITLLRFKFQNATKFGNYLRFSIFFLGLLKISRRGREVQWQNWGDILVMLADLLLKFHKTVMVI